MWKQVKKFNQRKAGTQAGWCLRNVRLGYGIAPKYASAWEDWRRGNRNTGAIPKGVDVPVYFWWGRYGHIGVKLADGRFWTDGKIYSSLWRYRITHPAVVYRGWSKEVNDVTVIKYETPKYKMPKVGSKITLNKVSRSTFKKGTKTIAGVIRNPKNWVYTVRGYDPRYPNRVIINTASGGGNGVALALYYFNGKRIEGWK